MNKPVTLEFRLDQLKESMIAAVALHNKEIEDAIAEQLDSCIRGFDFNKVATQYINEAIDFQIKKTIETKIKDVIENAVSSALYDTGNYNTLKAKIAEQMKEVIEKKFK